MNPLVQGWSSAHTLPTWGTQPSLHGALPYHTSANPTFSPPDSFATFTFISFGDTILNLVLVASDNNIHFHITTDDSDSMAPGRTVVEDASWRRVGLVTWGPRPKVVIEDLKCMMHTSQWLYLSSNKACRTMIAENEKYSRRPSGGCIELFAINNSDSRALARISQGAGGTMLQLTPRAIQKQLLNVVVISAVLLMSGRGID
ncbi:hypothetical protein DFH06DRAFT_1297710 [Mycena polygramma]|nr:hypothetical protein DFH06DRAFT_1297710 [Mycena polygramma]